MDVHQIQCLRECQELSDKLNFKWELLGIATFTDENIYYNSALNAAGGWKGLLFTRW